MEFENTEFGGITCLLSHLLGYLQPCAVPEARLAEYKAQVAAAEAHSVLAATPYSWTLGTLAPPRPQLQQYVGMLIVPALLKGFLGP